MPRVERFTSKEPIPVEQAQLIDPSSFPADYSSAEALKEAGRAANVEAELAIRKQEMQDHIGLSNIKAAMDLAQSEYQRDIINKPLNEHAAILQKHRNAAAAAASKERLSKEARQTANITLQLWSDKFRADAERVTLKALEKEAIIKVTADYEKALTEDDIIAIEEAELEFDDQMLNSFTPAEAAKMKESAEGRAIKQMEVNAMKRLEDRAAVNPANMIGIIDDELKARKKGKTSMKIGQSAPDFALLSNSDLRALQGYAIGVQARDERVLAEHKTDMQAKIGSQLLADLWEGKLIDPQKITDAIRNEYITSADAKFLRKALLNPDPPTLNLKNYAEVEQAITDIGIGNITKTEALGVLYKNLDGIDPTTGKSLVAEIFTEHDRSNAEMRKEGRSLMEDLIRDKDPISGFFSDDQRQILGTSEAILVLDREIEKAAKKGKPLERREILIKAVGIGQQIKARIKKEEEKGVEPKLAFEEKETTSPYPEYPDAFLENGIWKVIKAGKKYRIEE